MITNDIKSIFIGMVVVASLSFMYMQKSEIDELRLSNSNKQIEIVSANDTIENLKKSIDDRNKEIDAQTDKYQRAKESLKKQRNLPRKVKYIKIPREVLEVESDECKDIKNAINAIRGIEYNSL